MRTTSLICFFAVLCSGGALFAQSSQYKRPGSNAADVPKDAGKAAAPAPATAPAAPADGAKVDVSDLEQKYWAPKDTDFSVVQNRTYTKANKMSGSIGYASLINDSYSDGAAVGWTLNYFFSERMGVELSLLNASLRNNEVSEGFLNDPGNTGDVVPNHSKITDSYGVSFNYVPIYAKVSFLNKSIIYFDMAISPGLAVVNYEQQIEPKDGQSNRQQSTVAFTLDLTQYFFLDRWFALRFDLRNMWYREQKVNYKNGTVIDDFTNNTTWFMFGTTFYF
jgi:outer membrane beta-barrel protein